MRNIILTTILTVTVSCGEFLTDPEGPESSEESKSQTCTLTYIEGGAKIICDGQEIIVKDGEDGKAGKAGSTGAKGKSGKDGSDGAQGAQGEVINVDRLSIMDANGEYVGRLFQQVSDTVVRVVMEGNYLITMNLSTGLTYAGTTNNYQAGVFAQSGCVGDTFAITPKVQKFRNFSFTPVVFSYYNELMAVDYDSPVAVGVTYGKSTWNPEAQTCGESPVTNSFPEQVYAANGTGIYFDFTAPYSVEYR